jgi:hypothetical protein
LDLTREASKMVVVQFTLSNAKRKMATTKTTSTNKARLDYKKATGKKLKRSQEVDHKDNKGRKGRDGIKNLRVLSKKKNVGLENKRRAKKK